MERIKRWIKEQSQKPRFGAKVLALILMIIILLMPKNTADNSRQDNTEKPYSSESISEE